MAISPIEIFIRNMMDFFLPIFSVSKLDECRHTNCRMLPIVGGQYADKSMLENARRGWSVSWEVGACATSCKRAQCGTSVGSEV